MRHVSGDCCAYRQTLGLLLLLCVVFTYSICPLFWSRRTNLRPVISVIVIAPAPSIIAFSERLRISPVAFLGIFQQRVGDVRR
jgi:hypothetical protein